MKPGVYTRPARPMRITVKSRPGFANVEIARVPEIIAVDSATECHVTPPDVAARMVRYLGEVGDYLTLEPSAGTGNLARPDRKRAQPLRTRPGRAPYRLRRSSTVLGP
jgi:hypothetical protein